MKAQWFLLICLTLVSSKLSAYENYRDWKDRPQERFKKAERTFDKARRIILDNYVDAGLNNEKLYEAALLGMLQNMDPKMKQWNTLLSPREYAEFKTNHQNEIVGVGIAFKFDKENGISKILRIIPGSPAEKARIEKNDQILKVDGKSFKGKTTRDLVYAIRGKTGSFVELTLLRDEQVIKEKLRRAKVNWKPVKLDYVDNGTAVIQITSFSEGVVKALETAVKEVQAKKAPALILDMRQNTGGALDKAVAALDFFIDKGKPLVLTEGRRGKKKTYRAKSRSILSEMPLVVLIQKTTASAAEFFAAALAEHRGALLVGTPTFGKWTVQKMVELPNGYAMKYTVAKFKSPKGRYYDGVGISPDFHVPTEVDMGVLRWQSLSERLKSDVQLKSALTLLARGEERR